MQFFEGTKQRVENNLQLAQPGDKKIQIKLESVQVQRAIILEDEVKHKSSVK